MTPSDILFVFFVLLQLADIYTTYRILKCGGRELNPVMAGMFNWFGLLPTLIWIKVLAISAIWLADYLYLTSIVCIVYVAVIAHNIRQLRK